MQTFSYIRDGATLLFCVVCLMGLYALGFASVAFVGALLMQAAEINHVGRQISPDNFFAGFIFYTGTAGSAVGLLCVLADWRGFCRAMLGHNRARKFV